MPVTKNVFIISQTQSPGIDFSYSLKCSVMLSQMEALQPTNITDVSTMPGDQELNQGASYKRINADLGYRMIFPIDEII